jgi:carboxyl-terminal processing protease
VIEPDGDEMAFAARQGDPYQFPLALLIDRGTASAAELFAGCLKAHGRAVLVGETTYGKGSIQKLVPGFAEPGAHYATVATFILPNGEPIEGRGVSPHIGLNGGSPGQAGLYPHTPVNGGESDDALALACAALRGA